MSDRVNRIARNEARFREINEALRDDLAQLPEAPSAVRFVCECGTRSCEATLEATFGEFARVRSHPRHFFVLPGHEIVDVESVVERYEGYLVVEKPEEVADIVER